MGGWKVAVPSRTERGSVTRRRLGQPRTQELAHLALRFTRLRVTDPRSKPATFNLTRMRLTDGLPQANKLNLTAGRIPKVHRTGRDRRNLI